MYRWSIRFIVGLLLVSLVGCEFSASTARITNVELAHGFQDNKAVDVTQGFAPTDSMLHAVVTVSNAPDSTKLKAVWTAVEADGGQIKDQLIDQTEVTGGGVADFTLSNNQAWPIGKYKVDVYLNDELARTVEFNIQ